MYFFVDKDNQNGNISVKNIVLHVLPPKQNPQTHKPFAPQLTPDCGAFFVRFPLLLIICRLQPALLSIHSEQEHYPNNKKGGQCENGDSV